MRIAMNRDRADIGAALFFIVCLLAIVIGLCRGCDDDGGHGQRVIYAHQSS